MKPIILITAAIADDERLLRLSRAYTTAVEKAGGIPVVSDCAAIENISVLLDIADGVLLSGGGDIDPFFFGEGPLRELGEISPMRDEFELELAQRSIQRNMPLLAICRGAQLLNVALGGAVYQDIYTQFKKPLLKHSQEAPRHYASHYVEITAGSALGKIVRKNRIRVNSFHHQAVSKLGNGIVVSATADDGIPEAIERSSGGFCIGVQWHPENMIEYPEHFAIFLEFIKKAGAANDMDR